MPIGDDFSRISDYNELLLVVSNVSSEEDQIMNLYESSMLEPSDL